MWEAGAVWKGLRLWRMCILLIALGKLFWRLKVCSFIYIPKVSLYNLYAVILFLTTAHIINNILESRAKAERVRLKWMIIGGLYCTTGIKYWVLDQVDLSWWTKADEIINPSGHSIMMSYPKCTDTDNGKYLFIKSVCSSSKSFFFYLHKHDSAFYCQLWSLMSSESE